MRLEKLKEKEDEFDLIGRALTKEGKKQVLQQQKKTEKVEWISLIIRIVVLRFEACLAINKLPRYRIANKQVVVKLLRHAILGADWHPKPRQVQVFIVSHPGRF